MVRYRTVDVFESIIASNAAWFESCVIHAARDLGLPNAPSGADRRRLERLCTVLARIDGWEERTPAFPAIDQGWGRLAHVIRTGYALVEDVSPVAYQPHRADAGQAAATEVAARFLRGRVLDAGCGSGVYGRAHNGGEVVFADRADVVALVPGDVQRLPCDLLTAEWAPEFDTVLLCNVTHLLGEAENRLAIQRLSGALRPGGTLVVKDFDPQHPVGEWFALNMCLYTDAGDVWSAKLITEWLTAAGLEVTGRHRLDATETGMVITARSS